LCAPRAPSTASIMAKVVTQNQKTQAKHYDPFISQRGKRTACDTRTAAYLSQKQLLFN
jgi:hypothetical protein